MILTNPKYAIIHKSASDIAAHDNVAVIDGWHKERGFCCKLDDGTKIHIGYHVLIHKNGNISWLRPLDKRGAHCYGYNSKSIGICLAGNKQFTEIQRSSLALVIDEIETFLGYKLIRKGHCELDKRKEKKDCPYVHPSWYR